MNRFWHRHRGLLLTGLCFVLCMALGLWATSLLEGRNHAQQQALIRKAALRAATTCYATEGFYPFSLDYL